MKIALISCFTLEHRVEYIIEALKEETQNLSVILSDFDHRLKTKITEKNSDIIYIDTKMYKRNLSFRRICSHYDFSKKVVRELEKIKPDIIYSMVPPNFLVKHIIKYKNKNKDAKVIFDIIDLWPETLPFGKLKNMLAIPLYFWKRLRDKNLKKADFVVTECNLFQKMLLGKLTKNTEIIYLADEYIGYEQKINNSFYEVCYIGSINNIVDIDLIVKILSKMNQYKKTKLNIVGDGEKREELIKKLEENNIEYKYHGKTYENKIKKEITDNCIFGINLMKESTCVGLTMKSLEYFKFGLPIINNIKEDTKNLVQEYNIGFNITENNIDEIVKKIMSMTKEDFKKMRENVHKMHEEKFNIKILKEKVKYIISNVIN